MHALRDFTPLHVPLSQNARDVVTEASSLAKRFGHQRTTLSLILLAICDSPDGRATLRLADIKADDLKRKLAAIYTEVEG